MSDLRMKVLPPETVSMRLKDGTRLDADIYRPETPGSYPVLLQRQAYGRRIACSICYAHPAWYASHGYIVVVQDVRGRGTSEGIFRPGENEIEDGAEAVEWAAKLDGANGHVGMYGFSYQSYNQLLAAAGDSPSLKALAPAMGPWDAAKTWAYENGAMRMKQMVGWGVQITAEAARRAGDDEAYAALMAVNAAPPLNGPIAARPAILEKYRSYSHVMDWLETPDDADYWKTISPAKYQEKIAARKLPMLFIGGWFDTHLASTVEAYKSLAHNMHPLTRMVVGPWLHFPWVAKVGDYDFGPNADRDMDAEHIRFFDSVLKGVDAGAEGSTVELFDMGKKEWVGFEGFPEDDTVAPSDLPPCGGDARQGRGGYNAADGNHPPLSLRDISPTRGEITGSSLLRSSPRISNVPLHLTGSGRASIDQADGKLASHAPEAEGEEFIVHDPWRPAPVTGGAYGVPPGPADRRVTDERGDVVTFTTSALDTEITLAGEPSVALSVTSDRPSFDLSCTLSRVTEDGKVRQISSGYVHYRKVPQGLAELKLTGTCVTLLKGERLRLSIAASDYPAHPVNPGTGEDPVSTPKTRAVVTTIRIAHGASQPSILNLPIVQTGESR